MLRRYLNGIKASMKDWKRQEALQKQLKEDTDFLWHIQPWLPASTKELVERSWELDLHSYNRPNDVVGCLYRLEAMGALKRAVRHSKQGRISQTRWFHRNTPDAEIAEIVARWNSPDGCLTAYERLTKPQKKLLKTLEDLLPASTSEIAQKMRKYHQEKLKKRLFLLTSLGFLDTFERISESGKIVERVWSFPADNS